MKKYNYGYTNATIIALTGEEDAVFAKKTLKVNKRSRFLHGYRCK